MSHLLMEAVMANNVVINPFVGVKFPKGNDRTADMVELAYDAETSKVAAAQVERGFSGTIKHPEMPATNP